MHSSVRSLRLGERRDSELWRQGGTLKSQARGQVPAGRLAQGGFPAPEAARGGLTWEVKGQRCSQVLHPHPRKVPRRGRDLLTATALSRLGCLEPWAQALRSCARGVLSSPQPGHRPSRWGPPAPEPSPWASASRVPPSAPGRQPPQAPLAVFSVFVGALSLFFSLPARFVLLASLYFSFSYFFFFFLTVTKRPWCALGGPRLWAVSTENKQTCGQGAYWVLNPSLPTFLCCLCTPALPCLLSTGCSSLYPSWSYLKELFFGSHGREKSLLLSIIKLQLKWQSYLQGH